MVLHLLNNFAGSLLSQNRHYCITAFVMTSLLMYRYIISSNGREIYAFVF